MPPLQLAADIAEKQVLRNAKRGKDCYQVLMSLDGFSDIECGTTANERVMSSQKM